MGSIEQRTPVPELLTIEALAALWSVKPQTLRAWAARGQLPPPLRIGRKLFFRASDLRAFLEQRSKR